MNSFIECYTYSSVRRYSIDCFLSVLMFWIRRSVCMSWGWLVEMLRRQLSPDRLRLNTRVSFVSVSDAENSAFPCLVRCYTDDDSNKAQESVRFHSRSTSPLSNNHHMRGRAMEGRWLGVYGRECRRSVNFFIASDCILFSVMTDYGPGSSLWHCLFLCCNHRKREMRGRLLA